MGAVTLSVIDRAGNSRQVTAATGQLLMHVLRDHIDSDIGICGGELSCGTCVVRLNPGWTANIAAASGDEREMLDALGAGDNARLGCQLRLDEFAGGMQATLLQEE